MSETPKQPRRAMRARRPSAKKKVEELRPQDQEYLRNSQQETYEPPPKMVPLNDPKYFPKEKIGKKKAVRGPGQKVDRVGLGGLRVIHSNPIDYHGNIDVQPDGPDAA